MPPPEQQLTQAFAAVPAAVTAARHAVLAFARRAGASPRTCEDLALAISEAVANVVVHGYVDAVEPGPLEVRATAAAEQLHVVVADAGRGLRPRTDSPGLGMGLALMSEVSQRCEVCERPGGGVELHMTFALDGG